MRSAVVIFVLVIIGPALLTAESSAQVNEQADSVSTTHDAAADDDERARSHFYAGDSYYERGRFEDALREFRMSHELSSHPRLLFNMHSCLERLGRLTEAEEVLARYVGEDLSEEERRLGTGRLDALRARLDATETSEETSLTGLRRGAIAAFVVGGASLASFIAFASLSSSEESSLGGDSGCAPSCTDDDVSTLRTYNRVADISLGLAIAAVATGGLLWAIGKPRLEPIAGPGRVGVRFLTSF